MSERDAEVESFAKDCLRTLLEVWILEAHSSYRDRLSALIDRGTELFPPNVPRGVDDWAKPPL